MDTRLLAYERAATVTEIAAWANDLLGKEVPGSPGYQVVRILQFQFTNQGTSYAALLLVEVTNTSFDNQVALKEADMVEIEQITSSIETLPARGQVLSEE